MRDLNDQKDPLFNGVDRNEISGPATDHPALAAGDRDEPRETDARADLIVKHEVAGAGGFAASPIAHLIH